MIGEEDFRRLEVKVDKLLLLFQFGRDERHQLLISALDRNSGSLCWSDLRRYPELAVAYPYHEQFARDMLKLASTIGLVQSEVGNKLIYHRPGVDVMAGKESSVDLGGHKPNDPQLVDYLVKETSKGGLLNVKLFLDDRAPGSSDDWKDKVMDGLQRRSGIERARMGERWKGKDGKTITVGPDWFRLKVP